MSSSACSSRQICARRGALERPKRRAQREGGRAEGGVGGTARGETGRREGSKGLEPGGRGQRGFGILTTIAGQRDRSTQDQQERHELAKGHRAAPASRMRGRCIRRDGACGTRLDLGDRLRVLLGICTGAHMGSGRKTPPSPARHTPNGYRTWSRCWSRLTPKKRQETANNTKHDPVSYPRKK